MSSQVTQRVSGRLRRAGIVVAAVGVLLAVTGCLRVDQAAEFSPDGLVTGTLTQTVDVKVFASIQDPIGGIGAPSDDPQQVFTDIVTESEAAVPQVQAKLPDGFIVSTSNDPDALTVDLTLTYTKVPVESWLKGVNRFFTVSEQGTDPAEVGTEAPKLTGTVDLVDGQYLMDITSPAGGEMGALFGGAFPESTWSFTFPGQVVEGNQDQLADDGRTAVWMYKFNIDEQRMQVTASATPVPGSSGPPVILIIAGVLIVGAVTAVMWWWQRRGEGNSHAGEEPGEAFVPEYGDARWGVNAHIPEERPTEVWDGSHRTEDSVYAQTAGYAPEPTYAAPPVPPANWYPDPSQPGQYRWWDGQQWTEHTQPVTPPVP